MPKPQPALSPGKQLDAFLDKYDAKIASLARKATAEMRKRFPNANVLVYDNYNALAIGFVPTLRSSDAIFSIVPYPKYVTLFFLQGAGMPDPDQRLLGNASRVRRLVLESEKTLDDPQIISLMNAALHRAKTPLDPKHKGEIVIRSISAKQRPRRSTK